MKIVALLIALLANSFMSPGGWRSARGFNRYASALQQRLLPMGLWDRALGVAMLLVPMMLPVLILQLLTANVLFGLVWLILSVLALCFAFGGGETIEAELAHFLSAWRQGDEELARAGLVALRSGQPADDLAFDAMPEAAASAIVLRARTRLFAPVFWFMIFGPVGAVGYRLVVLASAFADSYDNTGPQFCFSVERLVFWLDWLPNRLLVLALALAGHFSWAWSCWEQSEGQADEVRLTTTSAGAVGLPPATDEAPRDFTSEAVADTHALLRRALYVWIAFVAALVLFGLG